MAVAAEVLVGGFDAQFVQPLEYECPICCLALRDPLQTPCGHHLCTSCVDRITKNGQFECPVDRRQANRGEAFPDTYFGRKILNFQVKCDHHAHGCDWKGELRHLQDHLTKSNGCQFLTVECLFSSVGCSTKMRRRNCDCHEDQEMKKHMRLLLEQNTTLVQRMATVDATVATMNATMATMNATMATMDAKIQSLQSENRELRSMIQSGEVPAHQRAEQEPFNVLWNIENWNESFQTAKQLQDDDYFLKSRPYYTGQPGYKVCLHVHPNGYGSNARTHLSVYMQLLRGHYDDEVTWPFTSMYSIILLDQQPCGHDITRTIDPPTVRVPPTERLFSRPTTQENNPWGWPKFISHADLYTRAYIKDKSLQLRLIVY